MNIADNHQHYRLRITATGHGGRKFVSDEVYTHNPASRFTLDDAVLDLTVKRRLEHPKVETLLLGTGPAEFPHIESRRAFWSQEQLNRFAQGWSLYYCGAGRPEAGHLSDLCDMGYDAAALHYEGLCEARANAHERDLDAAAEREYD